MNELICKLERVLIDFEDKMSYETNILYLIKDYFNASGITWIKFKRNEDRVMLGIKTNNVTKVILDDEFNYLEIYDADKLVNTCLKNFFKCYFTNVLKIEKLYEYLHTDNLTGLSNNNALEETKRVHPYVENTGVLFVDANGLGVINNTYGHEQGDELLKTIAKCLVNTGNLSFRKCETYRKGGDEFIVVCIGIAKQTFYNKIKGCMELLKMTQYSASFGFSYSEELIELDKLIKVADDDMYVQKEKYRESNPDKYLVKKNL